jgi:hypothetical protein
MRLLLGSQAESAEVLRSGVGTKLVATRPVNRLGRDSDCESAASVCSPGSRLLFFKDWPELDFWEISSPKTKHLSPAV